MPEHPRRPLITLAEAGELLAMSTRTVRRYIAAGYLDAVRVGPRAVRVRYDSVERLSRADPIGNPR